MSSTKNGQQRRATSAQDQGGSGGGDESTRGRGRGRGGPRGNRGNRGGSGRGFGKRSQFNSIMDEFKTPEIDRTVGKLTKFLVSSKVAERSESLANTTSGDAVTAVKEFLGKFSYSHLGKLGKVEPCVASPTIGGKIGVYAEVTIVVPVKEESYDAITKPLGSKKTMFKLPKESHQDPKAFVGRNYQDAKRLLNDPANFIQKLVESMFDTLEATENSIDAYESAYYQERARMPRQYKPLFALMFSEKTIPNKDANQYNTFMAVLSKHKQPTYTQEEIRYYLEALTAAVEANKIVGNIVRVPEVKEDFDPRFLVNLRDMEGKALAAYGDIVDLDVIMHGDFPSELKELAKNLKRNEMKSGAPSRVDMLYSYRGFVAKKIGDDRIQLILPKTYIDFKIGKDKFEEVQNGDLSFLYTNATKEARPELRDIANNNGFNISAEALATEPKV